MAMEEEGATPEEAANQIWMVDIDGLLTIVGRLQGLTSACH